MTHNHDFSDPSVKYMHGDMLYLNMYMIAIMYNVATIGQPISILNKILVPLTQSYAIMIKRVYFKWQCLNCIRHSSVV